MSGTELPDELSDALPTTVQVYRELEAADEPLTYAELTDRTNLARRTVREKTSILEDLGLAVAVWSTTHRRAYRLSGGRRGGTRCR